MLQLLFAIRQGSYCSQGRPAHSAEAETHTTLNFPFWADGELVGTIPRAGLERVMNNCKASKIEKEHDEEKAGYIVQLINI